MPTTRISIPFLGGGSPYVDAQGRRYPRQYIREQRRSARAALTHVLTFDAAKVTASRTSVMSCEDVLKEGPPMREVEDGEDVDGGCGLDFVFAWVGRAVGRSGGGTRS